MTLSEAFVQRTTLLAEIETRKVDLEQLQQQVQATEEAIVSVVAGQGVQTGRYFRCGDGVYMYAIDPTGNVRLTDAPAWHECDGKAECPTQQEQSGESIR